MRVEAEVTKTRGLAWILAATGVSIALLGFVALERTISASTFVVVATLVTAISLFALARGAPGRGVKGRVGVDGRGLSVDGELVIPRHALLHARVKDEPDGGHSVVVDARGLIPTHVVRVESARIAQALADTLEQPPQDLVVFDALPPWAHRIRWLAIVLTTSPWILLNALRHLPGFAIAVVMALYGLVGLPMLLPQKVAVGEDGLLLRWAGRRRFIPFGALRAVRATPLGLVLQLGDDRVVEIRLSHRSEVQTARRAAMLARIEEGMDVHRRLTPAEDEALLARGTRPIEAWIRDLTALGTAGALGYRAIAVPRERLWAVLENPSADPSARQGAAIALRERLDEAERERLATIAEKSASPRLRVALDAVSTMLDAPRLRVALEEAEEQASEEASMAARG